MFLDYNQNAKDRTVAAAYVDFSPLPEASVSAPLTWAEVPECDPADFRIRTVPRRLAERDDLAAGIDASPFSPTGLLELPRAPLGRGPRRRRAVAAPLPASARGIRRGWRRRKPPQRHRRFVPADGLTAYRAGVTVW